MPPVNTSALIPDAIVREHQVRAAELMRARRIDALVVFRGTNILGFAGVPLEPSDRLVCAVLTADAEVELVCPAFESSIADPTPCRGRVRTWREHDDPHATLAEVLGQAGLDRAAIALDGYTWIAAAARIRAALPRAHVVDDPGVLESVRLIKSDAELDVMREAARATGRIYGIVKPILAPGISEVEAARRADAGFAALGYTPGHSLLQGGPNAAVPHQPSNARPIAEGDLVIVDYVAAQHSYLGDMTRTFAVGRPGEKARRAYRVVREAQRAAIAACRPGATCESVDAAARRVVEEAGLGEFFIHRTGHGIGLDVHEPPYLVAGNRQPLAAGMVVTVEPGVYVPGEFGVRIEDVVAVTPDGPRVLSDGVATDVSEELRD